MSDCKWEQVMDQTSQRNYYGFLKRILGRLPIPSPGTVSRPAKPSWGILVKQFENAALQRRHKRGDLGDAQRIRWCIFRLSFMWGVPWLTSGACSLKYHAQWSLLVWVPPNRPSSSTALSPSSAPNLGVWRDQPRYQGNSKQSSERYHCLILLVSTVRDFYR